MKPRYKKRSQPAAKQEQQAEAPFFGGEPSFFSPAAAVQRKEAAAGSGQPLPAQAQQFFGGRMGHDFSQVQIHTGPQAASSANALNAKAYTHNQHIVFNEGQFNPQSAEGQKLLAHELTHVAQQSEGRSAGIQRSPLTEEGEKGKALWDSMENSIEIDGFEFGSAELTPRHTTVLGEYKQKLNLLLGRYPDSFLTLWGHTDAVDTEAKNEALGLARAEAVKNELTNGDYALPASIINAYSMGENDPVVKSPNREPKNRRVQLMFTARRFHSPQLDFTPLPPLGGNYEIPPIVPPYQYVPSWEQPPGFNYGKIPDINIPRKTPIESILEKDPILKALPKDWRDKVIDAAKDADEKVVDAALDYLPVDDTTKNAVKAAVKAAIQMAKGKTWKPPVPPLYEMPPSGAPPYQKAPGEQIFKLPPLKFDENEIFKWFKKKL